MSRSQIDALEDENVHLVWAGNQPVPASLEDAARHIIQRAVALGRSLERHPSNRYTVTESE